MIKIATELFKKEVNRAVRGVGLNSLSPLTTMIGLKVKSNKLYLCTKDGVNDTQVIIDKVVGEDISIAVAADLFSKLISKLTSETIELDIQEDKLVVKGNGNYTLPLIVDEEGVVEYPDIKFSKVGLQEKEINLTTLKNIFNFNRLSLGKDFTEPYLTGYYIGKEVITSDGEVACFNEVELVKDEEPLLLNSSTLNLLVNMDDEKVKMVRKGNQLYFYTKSMIVSCNELAGVEDYPVSELKAFIEEDFNSKCKISKGLLLEVLDRLSLFVEVYDEGSADFVFTKDGIQVSSRKESSIEVLPYAESNDFESCSYLFDVPTLKAQVQAINQDVIEIHYGNEIGLKLVCGNVSIIISASAEEE